jgi:predicted alpha/beta superfamily hydrolase
LFNHSNLFNAYIAIDPSLWWDDQNMLKQTKKDIAQKKFNHKIFFLGIANVKPANTDTAQMKKDTTPNTSHIRSNFQLSDALSKNKQTNTNFFL